MAVLPRPPLTIDQLYLLARDNTVAPGRDGFSRLGIQPHSFSELLPRCLAARDPGLA
jgi:NADH dehydrogenase